MRFGRIFGWCYVAVLASALGCGSFKSEPTPSRAQALASIIAQFRMQQRGQIPEDESVLREFAESHRDSINSLGVDSVNDLLVSDVDNEPFELLLGRSSIQTRDGRQIVARERVGAGGVRSIIFATGEVEELDDSEYEALTKRR